MVATSITPCLGLCSLDALLPRLTQVIDFISRRVLQRELLSQRFGQYLLTTSASCMTSPPPHRHPTAIVREEYESLLINPASICLLNLWCKGLHPFIAIAAGNDKLNFYFCSYLRARTSNHTKVKGKPFPPYKKSPCTNCFANCEKEDSDDRTAGLSHTTTQGYKR